MYVHTVNVHQLLAHALASGYLRDHQPPTNSTPESRQFRQDGCVYLRPSPVARALASRED